WIVRVRRTWDTRACRDINVRATQVFNLVQWVICKATWADHRAVHCIQVESTGVQQRQTHEGLSTWDGRCQVAGERQCLTELITVLASQGDRGGTAHRKACDGVVRRRNTELTLQVALQFLSQEGFPLVVDRIIRVILSWTFPVCVEGSFAANRHNQGDVVWLVQLCRVNVVDPSVGALGRTQTIQQVARRIAASARWLNWNWNGTTHGCGPHITALNPILHWVPVTPAVRVEAQPVAVRCFCLRGASNGEHGSYHDYRREHGDRTAIKSHAADRKELHVSPNNF